MTEEKYQEIAPLLELLHSNGRSYDYEKIKSAFLYAKELHEGQMRLSGEPYIMHPISVAEIVANLGLDTDSVCAAFLHDTVEDCPDKTNLDEITRLFGSDVALLVDGVTKIKSINVEEKEEAQIESIRKMLLAMSKDIRVIFIKLCDRVHNMRTLYVKKDAKRRATALEKMHVYAPLAHRLGMQKIKQELETYALQYLDPIGYNEIKAHIEEKYGKNVNFIETIKANVKEELEKIWSSAAEMIAQYLDSGRDVAFITLGDTSIFSTYSYVQKKLYGRYEIETIPGITSFTACAAARNKALVEQNDILTIVPKIDDRLEHVLEYSDSIVLMKASRNTSDLEETIEAKNRPKEIYSVQNCTRENEKIIEGFSNEKPYLTTTVIKFDAD